MSGASTIHSDMRAAARAKLLTLGGLPVMAWEGRSFADQLGTPFIREQFRPVSSRLASIGVNGTIEHRMVCNLTLFYPANNGTVALDTMAGSIFTLFLPGQSLTYGSSSGIILNTERSSLLQEPNWISCTVTATILAHTAG